MFPFLDGPFRLLPHSIGILNCPPTPFINIPCHYWPEVIKLYVPEIVPNMTPNWKSHQKLLYVPHPSPNAQRDYFQEK